MAPPRRLRSGRRGGKARAGNSPCVSESSATDEGQASVSSPRAASSAASRAASRATRKSIAPQEEEKVTVEVDEDITFTLPVSPDGKKTLPQGNVSDTKDGASVPIRPRSTRAKSRGRAQEVSDDHQESESLEEQSQARGQGDGGTRSVRSKAPASASGQQNVPGTSLRKSRPLKARNANLVETSTATETESDAVSPARPSCLNIPDVAVRISPRKNKGHARAMPDMIMGTRTKRSLTPARSKLTKEGASSSSSDDVVNWELVSSSVPDRSLNSAAAKTRTSLSRTSVEVLNIPPTEQTVEYTEEESEEPGGEESQVETETDIQTDSQDVLDNNQEDNQAGIRIDDISKEDMVAEEEQLVSVELFGISSASTGGVCVAGVEDENIHCDVPLDGQPLFETSFVGSECVVVEEAESVAFETLNPQSERTEIDLAEVDNMTLMDCDQMQIESDKQEASMDMEAVLCSSSLDESYDPHDPNDLSRELLVSLPKIDSLVMDSQTEKIISDDVQEESVGTIDPPSASVSQNLVESMDSSFNESDNEPLVKVAAARAKQPAKRARVEKPVRQKRVTAKRKPAAKKGKLAKKAELKGDPSSDDEVLSSVPAALAPVRKGSDSEDQRNVSFGSASSIVLGTVEEVDVEQYLAVAGVNVGEEFTVSPANDTNDESGVVLSQPVLDEQTNTRVITVSLSDSESQVKQPAPVVPSEPAEDSEMPVEDPVASSTQVEAVSAETSKEAVVSTETSNTLSKSDQKLQKKTRKRKNEAPVSEKMTTKKQKKQSKVKTEAEDVEKEEESAAEGDETEPVVAESSVVKTAESSTVPKENEKSEKQSAKKGKGDKGADVAAKSKKQKRRKSEDSKEKTSDASSKKSTKGDTPKSKKKKSSEKDDKSGKGGEFDLADSLFVAKKPTPVIPPMKKIGKLSADKAKNARTPTFVSPLEKSSSSSSASVSSYGGPVSSLPKIPKLPSSRKPSSDDSYRSKSSRHDSRHDTRHDSRHESRHDSRHDHSRDNRSKDNRDMTPLERLERNQKKVNSYDTNAKKTEWVGGYCGEDEDQSSPVVRWEGPPDCDELNELPIDGVQKKNYEDDHSSSRPADRESFRVSRFAQGGRDDRFKGGQQMSGQFERDNRTGGQFGRGRFSGGPIGLGRSTGASSEMAKEGSPRAGNMGPPTDDRVRPYMSDPRQQVRPMGGPLQRPQPSMLNRQQPQTGLGGPGQRMTSTSLPSDRLDHYSTKPAVSAPNRDTVGHNQATINQSRDPRFGRTGARPYNMAAPSGPAKSQTPTTSSRVPPSASNTDSVPIFGRLPPGQTSLTTSMPQKNVNDTSKKEATESLSQDILFKNLMQRFSGGSTSTWASASLSKPSVVGHGAEEYEIGPPLSSSSVLDYVPTSKSSIQKPAMPLNTRDPRQKPATSVPVNSRDPRQKPATPAPVNSRDPRQKPATATPAPVNTRDPRIRKQMNISPILNSAGSDLEANTTMTSASDTNESELDKEVIFGLKGITSHKRPVDTDFTPGFYTEAAKTGKAAAETPVGGARQGDTSMTKLPSQNVQPTDRQRLLDQRSEHRLPHETEKILEMKKERQAPQSLQNRQQPPESKLNDTLDDFDDMADILNPEDEFLYGDSSEEKDKKEEEKKKQGEEKNKQGEEKNKQEVQEESKQELRKGQSQLQQDEPREGELSKESKMADTVAKETNEMEEIYGKNWDTEEDEASEVVAPPKILDQTIIDEDIDSNLEPDLRKFLNSVGGDVSESPVAKTLARTEGTSDGGRIKDESALSKAEKDDNESPLRPIKLDALDSPRMSQASNNEEDEEDKKSVTVPSDSDDEPDEDDMDPRRRRYLGKSESRSSDRKEEESRESRDRDSRDSRRPRYGRSRSRSPERREKESRESRESRYRDDRDPRWRRSYGKSRSPSPARRDRESRESRGHDSRDPRRTGNPAKSRSPSPGKRERETRESQESRRSRDPDRRDPPDSRDTRDSRDPRDSRDTRDSGDTRHGKSRSTSPERREKESHGSQESRESQELQDHRPGRPQEKSKSQSPERKEQDAQPSTVLQESQKLWESLKNMVAKIQRPQEAVEEQQEKLTESVDKTKATDKAKDTDKNLGKVPEKSQSAVKVSEPVLEKVAEKVSEKGSEKLSEEKDIIKDPQFKKPVSSVGAGNTSELPLEEQGEEPLGEGDKSFSTTPESEDDEPSSPPDTQDEQEMSSGCTSEETALADYFKPDGYQYGPLGHNVQTTSHQLLRPPVESFSTSMHSTYTPTESYSTVAVRTTDSYSTAPGRHMSMEGDDRGNYPAMGDVDENEMDDYYQDQSYEEADDDYQDYGEDYGDHDQGHPAMGIPVSVSNIPDAYQSRNTGQDMGQDLGQDMAHPPWETSPQNDWDSQETIESQHLGSSTSNDHSFDDDGQPSMSGVKKLVQEASKKLDMKRMACVYKVATDEVPTLPNNILTCFAAGLLRKCGSYLPRFMEQLVIVRGEQKLSASDKENLVAICKAHVGALRKMGQLRLGSELLYEVKDTLPLYSAEYKHLTSLVERVYVTVEVYLELKESTDAIIQLLISSKWPRPTADTSRGIIMLRIRCLKKLWEYLTERYNAVSQNLRGEELMVERRSFVKNLMGIFKSLFLSKEIDEEGYQLDPTLRKTESLSEMFNMILVGAAMLDDPPFLMTLCSSHIRNRLLLPLNEDVAYSVVNTLYMSYNKTKDYKFVKMATRIFPSALGFEEKYEFFKPPTLEQRHNILFLTTTLAYWEVHLLIELFLFMMSQLDRSGEHPAEIFTYNIRIKIRERGVNTFEGTSGMVSNVLSRRLCQTIRILCGHNNINERIHLSAYDVKSYIANVHWKNKDVFLGPLPPQSKRFSQTEHMAYGQFSS